MADSKIITNSDQQNNDQSLQKKKWVFGWTSDAFKDGEFLWAAPKKEIDTTNENKDFFDPLEELIPIAEEAQSEQNNNQETIAATPEIKKEVNDDFDLSEGFEPIDTVETNTISEKSPVNEIKPEEVVLEPKENGIKKEEPTIWIERNSIDNTPEKVTADKIVETPEIKKEEIVENKPEKDEKEAIQIAPVVGKTETPEIKKEEEKIKKGEPEQPKKNVDEVIVKEEKEKEPENSNLKSKFYELLNITKKVYEMKELKKEDTFEILGMNTENQKIVYVALLGYNNISFDKKETLWEKNENHNLSFAIKDKTLWVEVSIDKETLFTEQKDLLSDEAKQGQVIEKINKFIFLIEQELKTIEKNKKEHEEKEKRRWLKWIFRNF